MEVLLAWESSYLGVPKKKLPQLEKLLQAVLNAVLAAAQVIFAELKPDESRLFGDADYAIRRVPGTFRKACDRNVDSCRLVLEGRCFKGWAVLEWDTRQFRIYAVAQKLLGPVPAWERLDRLCCETKASIYVTFTLIEESLFYSAFHRIDLQHPLLLCLDSAVQEIEEGKKRLAQKST